MAAQLGSTWKFLYNDATSGSEPNFAAPNFVEICNVRDVNQDESTNSADASTRCGGGYRQKLAGLKEGTIELEMIFDTADTNLATIRDASQDGTLLDIVNATGAVGTDGTAANGGTAGVWYWRAPMTVTNFSITAQLEEAVTASVTFEVAFHATQSPDWYTVS